MELGVMQRSILVLEQSQMSPHGIFLQSLVLLHMSEVFCRWQDHKPDSGGSQFFICVADARFLDNQYTVFGKVVSGMDVVDAIVSAPRDARDNPNDRIEMKVRLEDKNR